jgi:hypothetical protein
MIILVDTRQQKGKHDLCHTQLQLLGHRLYHVCLPYGDYMCGDNLEPALTRSVEELNLKYESDKTIPPPLRKSVVVALRALHRCSIDTKQNMQEIYGNIVQSPARFKNECELGGADMTVLIESGEIDRLENVHLWKNPRATVYYRLKKYGKAKGRPPMASKSLQKAMETISERYGTKWDFCKNEETAQRIIDILGGKQNEMSELP